eukprot:1230355-Amorphochlora_amoeboformis.AAC.2
MASPEIHFLPFRLRGGLGPIFALRSFEERAEQLKKNMAVVAGNASFAMVNCGPREGLETARIEAEERRKKVDERNMWRLGCGWGGRM